MKVKIKTSKSAIKKHPRINFTPMVEAMVLLPNVSPLIIKALSKEAGLKVKMYE